MSAAAPITPELEAAIREIARDELGKVQFDLSKAVIPEGFADAILRRANEHAAAAARRTNLTQG